MMRDSRRTPRYVVASVDHALRVATWLQLEGEITVAETAHRLGVAPSTAHRLLTTLVHRDYAVRSPDRTYRRGPALEAADRPSADVAELRTRALDEMQRLGGATGETVSLMIRTGTVVRFVASIESTADASVGSRDGMVFPAHTVTGGLLSLAELTSGQITELYSGQSAGPRAWERPQMDSLQRRLAQVRRHGVAVNRGLSEHGVVALGRAIRDVRGEAIAGIAVAIPATRCTGEQLQTVDGLLCSTVERVSVSITDR